MSSRLVKGIVARETQFRLLRVALPVRVGQRARRSSLTLAVVRVVVLAVVVRAVVRVVVLAVVRLAVRVPVRVAVRAVVPVVPTRSVAGIAGQVRVLALAVDTPLAELHTKAPVLEDIPIGVAIRVR